MRGLVLRWILNAFAILLVAAVFKSGVRVDSVGAALVAALLLGILNAVIRPVILLFYITYKYFNPWFIYTGNQRFYAGHSS